MDTVCVDDNRIDLNNYYYEAESTGSKALLATLSPNVTISDPSLDTDCDALCQMGLTPIENRQLQNTMQCYYVTA